MARRKSDQWSRSSPRPRPRAGQTRHVLRVLHLVTRGKARAGHRGDPVIEKLHRGFVRPRAIAIADAQVHIVSKQIRVAVGDHVVDHDVLVRIPEVMKPWHQPELGKGHGRTDGDAAQRGIVADLLQRGGDALEGFLKGAGHGFAFRRQFHGPVQAQEERPADLRLERLHLLRHGAGRDVELGGSAGKAQVPRRGLEGSQGIERRQAVVAADHGGASLAGPVGLNKAQRIADQIRQSKTVHMGKVDGIRQQAHYVRGERVGS